MLDPDIDTTIYRSVCSILDRGCAVSLRRGWAAFVPGIDPPVHRLHGATSHSAEEDHGATARFRVRAHRLYRSR